MSIDNSTKHSYTGDYDLDFIFSDTRKRHTQERKSAAKEAAHQQEIRERAIQIQKERLANKIIRTTGDTVKNLYPDSPIINPQKSIARPKTSCTKAREVKEGILTVLGYLTSETIFQIKNAKKEIGNIFFGLAITSAVISGGVTLLLDLPITIFLEYGIAPALIEGLIGSIVDPTTRKIYKDKFQDFFNSKLDDDKHSGRRH